jgi:pseudouridine kinase
MDQSVLVIGAMLLDTKGKPQSGLEPGTSNPAHLRHKRGGTARNVAENLGRLGVDVTLLSAIGDDTIGRWLIERTHLDNVNTDNIHIEPKADSGAYIAILDNDGTLAVALDDTRVMQYITPAYLYRHRSLFRDAAMVFLDGSLSESALETAVRLTVKYDKPLVFDPSSARLAYKFRPYLQHVTLAVPNEIEVSALTETSYVGFDPDMSLKAAHLLRRRGVGMGVITLSDFGLVYATANESGYIPPVYSEIVDSTGTGDAITSAIMVGLLEALPAIECMRLGAAAGVLTLQSNETVVPELSLDLLYEHLYA